jgi:hypothetical protein
MQGQEDAAKKLLTIELVPQTCWFSNVRSEVTPAQWDSLRKATAHHAGNRCQICGGRGPQWPVECHELWHYDDEQHIQTLLGLIALCPACHEVKHMGLANVRGRGHLATRHLAKVNGWTAAEAERYIADQFALWQQRSTFQWQLDLSWLEECGIQIQDKTRDGANRV